MNSLFIICRRRLLSLCSNNNYNWHDTATQKQWLFPHFCNNMNKSFYWRGTWNEIISHRQGRGTRYRLWGVRYQLFWDQLLQLLPMEQEVNPEECRNRGWSCAVLALCVCPEITPDMHILYYNIIIWSASRGKEGSQTVRMIQDHMGQLCDNIKCAISNAVF